MLKIKSAILISRPINFLIISFAVLIAGIIGNPIEFINYDLIFASLSLAFVSACGNVFNDIMDLDADRVNRPKRVLITGSLNLFEAKILVLIFGIMSVMLALFVSVQLTLFVIALLIIAFLYSLYFQYIVLFSNIVVSIMTASALIAGGLVVNNIKAALIPAAFAFFTNLIREIIKDVEDVKGDAVAEVNTLPHKYGIPKTIKLLNILIASLLASSLIPYVLKIYSIEYLLIIIVFVHSIFLFILYSFQKKTDIINFHLISNLVKVSMIFGLTAIYFGL